MKTEFSNTNKEQKSLAEIRKEAYAEGFKEGKAESIKELIDDLESSVPETDAADIVYGFGLAIERIKQIEGKNESRDRAD